MKHITITPESRASFTNNAAFCVGTAAWVWRCKRNIWIS